MSFERLSSSYQDPAGFVFRRDGQLLRQINQSYRSEYECLLRSGLYQAAVDAQALVSHQEVDVPLAESKHGWKVISPRTIGFVSYPYEWCFSQLKDAALLTLDIQKKAMAHGMSLKDASAYNIQFDCGRPILVDSLSFEQYQEGEPWVAYRQLCQHFLAPLALMSMRDVRLNQLLLCNLDGLPLDLAATLLPLRARTRLSLLLHLCLHAKMVKRYSRTSQPPRMRKLAKSRLLGIVEHLESAIRRLNWNPVGTQWADYYSRQTAYSPAGTQQKRRFVSQCIDAVGPQTVWDLGANTGEFSRLASDRGILTIAIDSDPAAVEKNYRRAKAQNEAHLLPLLVDLMHPSPSIGWENRERLSLIDRGPADLVLALALVHHLAISGNVPLPQVAALLNRIGRNLVIEFVPKHDPQVKRLLVSRRDIFADYTREAFEAEFDRFFTVERREPLADSDRLLYYMKSRNPP
jgi:hypothetical protein